jgi:arsenite methyltransferase
MVKPGGLRPTPNFGLDAPPIVLGFAALGVLGVALLIVARSALMVRWGVWAVVVGFGVSAAMTYSSKIGKVRARDHLLDRLRLSGDEDVLDLGCGSGLMLLGAAQRTPAGAATGVDLWRARDQAGSNRQQCLDNAHRLGLADRVTIVDADMTELPFPDASFDLVLACLSVHNLHPTDRRQQAIREAIRVLRPGGRLAVVDIFGTSTYLSCAAEAGMKDASRSRYIGHIFPPARIVTATAFEATA